jgi:hypothetical protein
MKSICIFHRKNGTKLKGFFENQLGVSNLTVTIINHQTWNKVVSSVLKILPTLSESLLLANIALSLLAVSAVNTIFLTKNYLSA